MIPIEDLKVGDIVYTIYHEGKLGYPGVVRPVKITKITDDKIETITRDGTKWRFHNDGEYGYIGLENNRFQFLNLFLGTEEEAEKADQERADYEDLYVETYNLFMEKYYTLPSDKLREIIRLLK